MQWTTVFHNVVINFELKFFRMLC